MFFIVSKVLLVLTQPIFWVTVLFIWALLTKNNKRKKRLLYITFAVFYFFSNGFIVNLFVRIWDIPPQNTGNKTYSCAIVLGGFTSVDANGNGYFNYAASRFIEALKLKTNGKVSKIVITGGSGLLFKEYDLTEADYVQQQLRLLNIPDSVVITENQSRNTIENAVFTKKILDEKKIRGPYLLVTSAFHMRRSLYTFKKAGLDVIPCPSDYAVTKTSFWITDFIPDAVAFEKWNTYTKELVGYITYHFKSFK